MRIQDRGAGRIRHQVDGIIGENFMLRAETDAPPFGDAVIIPVDQNEAFVPFDQFSGMVDGTLIRDALAGIARRAGIRARALMVLGQPVYNLRRKAELFQP
jgi:hypothetical protein